jgi:sigma-B regulation protein RsbU (phosphoserine phosphatase)
MTPARGADAVVLVAATAGCMARAGRLAEALPALIGSGTRVQALTLSEAGASCDGAAALVLMLGDGDVPDGMSSALDAAEECRVAVMLMAGSAPAARPDPRLGAMEPLDADDATVAAVLRGLLGRQRDVDRAVRELAVAARFGSGLRGEVARMQEELQLAAQVQREFLPRGFPAVGDIRIGVFWRPASWVSGDVYDVVRLDERHLGVFVADAVGHGVPAALLTMVICRGLPAKDVGHGTYRIVPPGEALARINAEMLAHQDHVTRFATAVYAVIDTQTGAMRIASAGHPSPVVLRAGGAMDLVPAEGGLLGVFEGEQYEEVAVQLEPGDRLLMHSDGLEQAFPGDPSGDRHARIPTKRYLDEFAAVRDAPDAAALVERVGRRIDMQFGSVRQADDVTLLVVERTRAAAGTGVDEHGGRA